MSGFWKAIGTAAWKKVPRKYKVAPDITKVKTKSTDLIDKSSSKLKGTIKLWGDRTVDRMTETAASLGRATQKLKGEKITKSGISKGKDIKK